MRPVAFADIGSARYLALGSAGSAGSKGGARLDLSQWIRRYLHERLAGGAAEFTYLVPDDLPAEFLTSPDLREVLTEVIDALVTRGRAPSARPHVEFATDRSSSARAVLITRRDGGAPEAGFTEAVGNWDRRARRCGGQVRLAHASDTTVVVYLDVPAGDEGTL